MAGGHGGSRWRWRARSVRRTEEGERVERECEGVPGGGVELRKTSRRGGGNQAGRRWPGRVAARATEQLRGEGETVAAVVLVGGGGRIR